MATVMAQADGVDEDQATQNVQSDPDATVCVNVFLDDELLQV